MVRLSYSHGHLDVPKGGKVRKVEMSTRLKAVLRAVYNARFRRVAGLDAEQQAALEAEQAAQAADKLVFPDGAGGYLEDHNLRNRIWVRLLEAAKLRQRRLHDLRHTFATLQLQGGTDPIWVSAPAVRAGETERLEHLCRYILRPPVAQDALELTADGKVLLRLRRPWRDGTRAICFEPSECLEKLAAMIPRPRIHLLLYHGAFAPRGRCHSGTVVVEDAPYRVPTPASGSAGAAPGADAPPAAYVRPPYVAWADLLRRVFALDILACPDCGGRLRLLATIADRAVVETILTHLALRVDLPQPSAARTPAWLPGVRNGADHEHDAGGPWAD